MENEAGALQTPRPFSASPLVFRPRGRNSRAFLMKPFRPFWFAALAFTLTPLSLHAATAQAPAAVSGSTITDSRAVIQRLKAEIESLHRLMVRQTCHVSPRWNPHGTGEHSLVEGGFRERRAVKGGYTRHMCADMNAPATASVRSPPQTHNQTLDPCPCPVPRLSPSRPPLAETLPPRLTSP